MGAKSTGKTRDSKGAKKTKNANPKKPYKGFPLTPHASGKWQKKINGKIHYFGRWGKRVNGVMERVSGDGWVEALELYKAQKDDLHAGRIPRVNKVGDELTVGELCNRFLNAKLARQQAGEITANTFGDYRQITDLLVSEFGKARLVDDLLPEDFEKLRARMAGSWGPTRLANGIQRVRSVFKFGMENIKEMRPVVFGSDFKKPGKAVMRRHKAKERAKNGEKLVEAADLRKLIEAAPANLRAMLYLGINCAFTNKDVADLPLAVVELDRGWIDFPRPKTGVDRRCPLWSETVEAIREAIAERPTPATEAAEPLVFLSVRGRPLIVRGQANPVSVKIRDLMKSTRVHRRGIGFATLRHTFRTVADATLDFPAVRLVMGHSDDSIDDTYRQNIADDRLIAVTEHVRRWLFEEGGESC